MRHVFILFFLDFITTMCDAIFKIIHFLHQFGVEENLEVAGAFRSLVKQSTIASVTRHPSVAPPPHAPSSSGGGSLTQGGCGKVCLASSRKTMSPPHAAMRFLGGEERLLLDLAI
jgi:hypothetical protein